MNVFLLYDYSDLVGIYETHEAAERDRRVIIDACVDGEHESHERWIEVIEYKVKT